MSPKNKKIIIVVVAILILIGGGYYFGSSKQDVNNAEALIAKEATDLVERVSLIMELPAEIPAVATIVDETKIMNEPFFAGTKNGDKILVFIQSQKLIIYRPSTNKIINSTTLALPAK
ncbi:MAG: hypothetical protein K8Q91_02195 [Candidatus Vogelbacteria bacterium]|nr:hypothetical protein [Candidatus Vogelbacteria bacterium]